MKHSLYWVIAKINGHSSLYSNARNIPIANYPHIVQFLSGTNQG